jgi:hypothetical protein
VLLTNDVGKLAEWKRAVCDHAFKQVLAAMSTAATRSDPNLEAFGLADAAPACLSLGFQDAPPCDDNR